MGDITNRSAQRRFIDASRARTMRRRRHVRLGIGLLASAPLASCVVHERDARSVASAPVAASPGAPLDRAPVIRGTSMALPGPSFLAGLAQRDRMRATLCLASAIYYEAATEPDEGQRAVAQVVLNRVRHTEWPNTVCGVVYQGSDRPGCQFSFACDGAMARGPSLSAWIRARRTAEAALNGDTYAPVGSSTFYHTLQVEPAWRHRLVLTAVVGAHIFYRLPADRAGTDTLRAPYVGGEPVPGPLPRIAPAVQLLTVGIPAPLVHSAAAAVPAVATSPPTGGDARYVQGALPDSDVRPEWRDSGQWIAPAR